MQSNKDQRRRHSIEFRCLAMNILDEPKSIHSKTMRREMTTKIAETMMDRQPSSWRAFFTFSSEEVWGKSCSSFASDTCYVTEESTVNSHLQLSSFIILYETITISLWCTRSMHPGNVSPARQNLFRNWNHSTNICHHQTYITLM